MSVIEERQVTGGNGRNPQTEKSRYVLDMEGFRTTDTRNMTATARILLCIPTCSCL